MLGVPFHPWSPDLEIAGKGEEVVVVVVVQTVEVRMCQSRCAPIMQSTSATTWLNASQRLPCGNGSLASGTRGSNNPNARKKVWVVHPPHTSVRKILEGITFSIALALEAKPLAQGEGVSWLLPSV